MKILRACVLFLAATGLLFGAGCGAGGSGQGDGIITMAPNLTETVFALGAGDRVIAVGDYCDYPSAVFKLPRAGGYLNPDLEKITLLQPGLLIVPGEHPQVSAYAAEQNLPVLNVHMDNFETIEAGIRTLGEALNRVDRAAELNAQIKAGRASLESKMASVERPSVLIITTRESHDLNSLYTAGKQSFVSELVELAGGRNLFGDEDKDYFEASKESVVTRAPEVILEFHCGTGLTESQTQAYYNDWQALSTLPAVKNGRIFFITISHGLRPGPRIIEVAERIATELHPEVMYADLR